jgi:receptor protein-tyrosine kinase
MSVSSEKVNVFTVSGRTPAVPAQIGSLLVESGRLTREEAERVVKLQLERGLRFGDAAVKLGLVTHSDIEQVLARQFDFPYLIPGQSRLSGELVAAYAPFDPRVETFRALRSHLMQKWFRLDHRLKHLAIVSPYREEGRSYLAANLAVVFSQLGERTLLVDADLRHPRQHMLFSLANKTGLSMLLAGRVGTEAIVPITQLPGLCVLPAGPLPPNPQELLGRAAFAEFLGEAEKQFDVVILDTSPSESSADAQAVVTQGCGALAVVRKDRTPVRAVKALADTLLGMGAPLMGAVVNTA